MSNAKRVNVILGSVRRHSPWETAGYCVYRPWMRAHLRFTSAAVSVGSLDHDDSSYGVETRGAIFVGMRLRCVRIDHEQGAWAHLSHADIGACHRGIQSSLTRPSRSLVEAERQEIPI